ncbi:hypothetical protein D3C85_1082430 [compost metagenome]
MEAIRHRLRRGVAAGVLEIGALVGVQVHDRHVRLNAGGFELEAAISQAVVGRYVNLETQHIAFTKQAVGRQRLGEHGADVLVEAFLGGRRAAGEGGGGQGGEDQALHNSLR